MPQSAMNVTESLAEDVLSPLARIQLMLADGHLKPDPAQMEGVAALEALWSDIMRREAANVSKPFWHWLMPKAGQDKVQQVGAQGLYIYGSVGRGKSMMMDVFYNSLPFAAKRRLHFHVFMAEIHAALHTHKQAQPVNLASGYKSKRPMNGNDLSHIIDVLYKDVKILCFDEFHVTDVADAMLLKGIFERLWQLGVITVMTSNWPPDALYSNGLQRKNFLPFIENIKKNVQVIELKGLNDFRSGFNVLEGGWFYPLGFNANEVLNNKFSEFLHGVKPSPLVLNVKNRSWSIVSAGRYSQKHVAMASFAELFLKTYGAGDYQALAEMLEILIITDIPKFSDDMLEEIKRFMTFVDVIYEARVRLLISAEVPLSTLYPDGKLAFEFERTASRLRELLLVDAIS